MFGSFASLFLAPVICLHVWLCLLDLPPTSCPIICLPQWRCPVLILSFLFIMISFAFCVRICSLCPVCVFLLSQDKIMFHHSYIIIIIIIITIIIIIIIIIFVLSTVAPLSPTYLFPTPSSCLRYKWRCKTKPRVMRKCCCAQLTWIKDCQLQWTWKSGKFVWGLRGVIF